MSTAEAEARKIGARMANAFIAECDRQGLPTSLMSELSMAEYFNILMGVVACEIAEHRLRTGST